MAKDFSDVWKKRIQTTGKQAAQKAKEVDRFRKKTQ